MNMAREQERHARNSHKHTLSVKMGGEETNPYERRSSKESRRSTEGRRSADIRHTIRALARKPEHYDSPASSAREDVAANFTFPMPKVRYLLISPLTGPISFLAAPVLGIKFWHRAHESQIFAKHNSLIIYGDQDIFASAKKLSAWVERMEADPGSQVSHVLVEGAGHFWIERGVAEELRQSLRTWEAGSWT